MGSILSSVKRCGLCRLSYEGKGTTCNLCREKEQEKSVNDLLRSLRKECNDCGIMIESFKTGKDVVCVTCRGVREKPPEPSFIRGI